MAGDAVIPVDATIAAFITRVLDELVAQVGDADAVRGALASLGVEGADADPVAEYVAGQTDVVETLAEVVPRLVLELGRAQPDLLSLVMDALPAFEEAATLASASPDVDLPGLPGAGPVIETLLALAVEHTLQGRTPAAWATFKALHLVGPELPVFSVIEDVLDSPTGFLWRRFEGLRRHLDITISGILSGPRAVSLVTTPVTPTDRVSDAVRAKVPRADVVLQRITLRLAADTYGEPHAVTFEVLGHDPGTGDAPEFAAVTVMSEPLAEPLHLSSAVTLDLAPLTEPFGVAVTGWGEAVPITDGQPTLRLGSAFAGGFSFGEPGGLRLTMTGPVLDPRVSGTGWSLRAGLEQLEVTIPPDIAGDVVALLLPRDGIRLRGKLVVVADGEGLHLEGGVALKTTWPDTLRLPGLLVRGVSTEIRTDEAGFTRRSKGWGWSSRSLSPLRAAATSASWTWARRRARRPPGSGSASTPPSSRAAASCVSSPRVCPGPSSWRSRSAPSRSPSAPSVSWRPWTAGCRSWS
jgi:hypothetical protein